MNQQILIQRTDFRRRSFEQPDVVLHISQPMQRHAAQQPALDRWEFVMLEVDAAGGTKKVEDALELIIANRKFLAARGHELAYVRMGRQLRELERDLGWRQYHVDH